MEELVPSMLYGFNWVKFYEDAKLYCYRESVGFALIVVDMGEIVDLESCQEAGRC